MAITQSITTIPSAGKRGVDVRSTFVAKQEAFQDALTDTTVGELNALTSQINTSATEMESDRSSSATSATNAAAAATDSSASADASALSAWNAKASELTSISYTENATDVVQYTSNGDGTFTEVVQTGISSVNTASGSIIEFADILTNVVSGIRESHDFVATEGQTTFALSYTPSSVDVYVAGIKLIEGIGSDFVANDGSNVILNTPVSDGTQVSITAWGSSNLANTKASTWTELITAIGGETLITIPNSNEYIVGEGHLVVSIEGNVQILGHDYTETSNTEITITTAMTAGEKLLIQKV